MVIMVRTDPSKRRVTANRGPRYWNLFLVAFAGVISGSLLSISSGLSTRAAVPILLTVLSILVLVRHIRSGVFVDEKNLQLVRLTQTISLPVEQIVDVRISPVFYSRPIYDMKILTLDRRVIPVSTVSWSRFADLVLSSPQPLPTSRQLNSLNAVRTSVGLSEVNAGSQN